MIIVENNFSKFILPNGYGGITIFPFIFILPKNRSYTERERLINHEKIHIRQQIELLVVLFYLWYVIEYLIKYFKNKKKSNIAYRAISFEREAYTNEYNMHYLKKRRFFAFFNYLK